MTADMSIWEKLSYYWEFPFVRYALIVGCLVALCSSLLGVTLVLKRYSFIGDGLSHVAFGVMAVATVLNLSNNMILVLPLTVLAAILLAYLRKFAGAGLYDHEHLPGQFFQHFRRCMYHTVRIYVHSDTDRNGGDHQHSSFRGGDPAVRASVQPDLCRDI